MCLNVRQPLAEIVRVAVEEALLLDEVAEHETVQHDRGIPFAVALFGQILDARHKRLVLDTETAIEVLRHLVGVHQKRGVHAIHHVHDGYALIRIEPEGDVVDLLQEKGRLVFRLVLDRDEMAAVDAPHGNRPQVVEILTRSRRPVDDEIVVAQLSELCVKHTANRRIGNRLAYADIHAEAPLLRHFRKDVGLPVRLKRNRVACRGIVPAALDEEARKVARPKTAEEFVSCHVLLLPGKSH